MIRKPFDRNMTRGLQGEKKKRRWLCTKEIERAALQFFLKLYTPDGEWCPKTVHLASIEESESSCLIRHLLDEDALVAAKKKKKDS